MLKTFNGALVIREQNGRAFYEAKWRDSRGRQVKRRVGPAWVAGDGAGGWRRRSGRVADGCFDEKTAIVEMRRLIDEREEGLAAGPQPGEVTFDQVAADWLHHVEHVDGIKPSTLASYRYLLRPPSARARKRGRRKAGGRLLAEFGGQPIDKITTVQVERWLARLDKEPISKRTINIHRQLVCSVLEHAVRRPDEYGIQTNVARATSKRREPDPVVLDFYEPEEVAALRARRERARTATPRGPRCPTPSARSAGGPTTRTPHCLSSPRSRGCGWANCSSCAGGTSASSARRSPSPRRGAAARSPRQSPAGREPCRSRRRPPPSLRV